MPRLEERTASEVVQLLGLLPHPEGERACFVRLIDILIV